MFRLGFVLAFVLLLVACDRFPGAPPNESGILKYDWVPADPRPTPAPLYCYQTLAAPECYATPVPGRILLGNFGAAPPPSPDAVANAAPRHAPTRASAPEVASPPQAAPLAPVELAPSPAPLQPAAPPQSAAGP